MKDFLSESRGWVIRGHWNSPKWCRQVKMAFQVGEHHHQLHLQPAKHSQQEGTGCLDRQRNRLQRAFSSSVVHHFQGLWSERQWCNFLGWVPTSLGWWENACVPFCWDVCVCAVGPLRLTWCECKWSRRTFWLNMIERRIYPMLWETQIHKLQGIGYSLQKMPFTSLVLLPPHGTLQSCTFFLT